MKRREFIVGLGASAAVWPTAVSAQQSAAPVIALVNAGSVESSPGYVAAFHEGLGESGYVEGQNATVDYHWLRGQYDRLPTLMADLVRRRVAVIATPCSTPATLAAKEATQAIPMVFAFGGNPVELTSKRLQLLHQLVPAVTRFGAMINPTTASADLNRNEIAVAASANGLQAELGPAHNAVEIETAFATFARNKVGALLVLRDAFFVNQRSQIATLAARHAILTVYTVREYVEAGGFVSSGPDLRKSFHQLGLYAGRILKGDKPADLPVQQATKFNFLINLKTAKALSLEIPPGILAIADEVID